jgi:hypothetical protein
MLGYHHPQALLTTGDAIRMLMMFIRLNVWEHGEHADGFACGHQGPGPG